MELHTTSFILSPGVTCSASINNNWWFPKLLRDNDLEVAGSVLTAGE